MEEIQTMLDTYIGTQERQLHMEIMGILGMDDQPQTSETLYKILSAYHGNSIIGNGLPQKLKSNKNTLSYIKSVYCETISNTARIRNQNQTVAKLLTSKILSEFNQKLQSIIDDTVHTLQVIDTISQHLKQWKIIYQSTSHLVNLLDLLAYEIDQLAHAHSELLNEAHRVSNEMKIPDDNQAEDLANNIRTVLSQELHALISTLRRKLDLTMSTVSTMKLEDLKDTSFLGSYTRLLQALNTFNQETDEQPPDTYLEMLYILSTMQ
ncbi:MAG: hypothetical protein PHU71_02390 [Candidatus Gracilibacteria bacterium]|nr:hypothetical protein [Candidatus Gracilibacteria bacterium]